MIVNKCHEERTNEYDMDILCGQEVLSIFILGWTRLLGHTVGQYLTCIGVIMSQRPSEPITMNLSLSHFHFQPVLPVILVVVVVYHVTIVAIGHGMLKIFWPFGTRLRSTHCREFNYLKLQTRLLRQNYSIITSPWP